MSTTRGSLNYLTASQGVAVEVSSAWSGLATANVSTRFTKVGSMVTAEFGGQPSANASSTHVSPAAYVPVGYRPASTTGAAQTVRALIPATDNGAAAVGLIEINGATGVVTVGVNGATGTPAAFTTSGEWELCSVSWHTSP